MQLQAGPAYGGEHLLAAAHAPGCCAVRAEPMVGLSGRHSGRHQHLAAALPTRSATPTYRWRGWSGCVASVGRPRS
eukprot:2659328-Pyramimonas_sp.AAC.1